MVARKAEILKNDIKVYVSDNHYFGCDAILLAHVNQDKSPWLFLCEARKGGNAELGVLTPFFCVTIKLMSVATNISVYTSGI